MATNDNQVSDAKGQRATAEVLADAIRVLTEAARQRAPEMQWDADSGVWRKDPTHTQQADWAEFVTQALAGAAANVGSVDAALAGRPGSWEADAVRNLLYCTVGYDEQYLFEHRTEPLRVVVDVEQVLTDLGIAYLYDESVAALDQMDGDATAHIDHTPYFWTYTRNAHGQFVTDDPTAPPWSIEAWRAGMATVGAAAEWVEALENSLINGDDHSAAIVKSPEAARAAAVLAEQEDALLTDSHARFEALAAQRTREWATYAEAFAGNVRQEAARRYPGIPVHIDLHTGPISATDVEPHLIEFATQHTPLPGSGIAPKDYPAGTSILDAEEAAGRLPHLRLPAPLSDTANSADQQERG